MCSVVHNLPLQTRPICAVVHPAFFTEFRQFSDNFENESSSVVPWEAHTEIFNDPGRDVEPMLELHGDDECFVDGGEPWVHGDVQNGAVCDEDFVGELPREKPNALLVSFPCEKPNAEAEPDIIMEPEDVSEKSHIPAEDVLAANDDESEGWHVLYTYIFLYFLINFLIFLCILNNYVFSPSKKDVTCASVPH